MPLDFTPMHFIRQADKALFGRFLAANGIAWDLPWADLRRSEIADIETRWRDLGDETLTRVEAPMRRIWSLARGTGNRLMVEEAELIGNPLPDEVKSGRFGIDRALWVWLERRPAFDLAWNCDRADRISGIMRHKRAGVPQVEPHLDALHLDALKEGVATYYWDQQGCGRRAHVQRFLRLGRQHHIFVYPEGYPDLFLGFDDAGEWTVRDQRPAFQVLFVYDAEDGTLEICAPGIRDVQEDLERIFAEHILRTELPAELPDRATYALDRLLDPNLCRFPVAATDPIVPGSVRVKKLRCGVRTHGGGDAFVGIVAFESSTRRGHEDIHAFIHRFSDEQHVPRALLTVLSAEMQATIQLPTASHGHSTRSLTWRLTRPDGCDLGDAPEELLIRRYLRTWELEHADAAVAAAAH